ncbi:MAG: ribosomal-processing cysteine protease Prp [Acholeplasmataceae bacterium]|jgi:uncharacterized protein YsxB (DUF464 family)|nr:ribosomal-processing cysteine protease Prp [Acholeplasmataceae bacterium]
MILVTVRTKEEIEEVSVSGHSEYADAGNDIVCSAVSTAMYVSLGLLEKVCPKYDFHSDEDKALMKLRIIQTNEFTKIILDNLVSTIEGISKDYARYLQVKFEK